MYWVSNGVPLTGISCPTPDTTSSIPLILILTVQTIFHTSFLPLIKSVSHQFSYMYPHLMCYINTHTLMSKLLL